MRILITNDDGMNASQLIPLIKWCQSLGEVTVFVPKNQQSGKSHSIGINQPFEAKLVEVEPGISLWAVDSSPADCVRLAVLGMKMEFDLVISGINRGLNIGGDIIYSGTVGAVSEALRLGIPGIALSTQIKYYDQAVSHLDEVFAFFREHQLMSFHDCYNVNIPADPKGCRITRQGGPYYTDDFQAIENDLYVPLGKSIWVDQQDLSLDTDATLHGYITVTPLTVDKTNWEVYRKLASLTE